MTRVAVAIALLGALLLAAAPVLGAEPGATPGTGGDPRSPGQGPGLVGDPAFAIGAVIVVAALSVALTLLWVRTTSDRPKTGRR